ncbi:MAG: ribosomal rna small subunit methyltransferase e [Verrucomicrobiaceae bacterium]|nr:ribosomal rna small subunit methyltransferase e [Verrucomicrobiaceae bacterium]
MTHAHFYVPPPAWETGRLSLEGDEARHCAQVTRHRAGDLVVIFDGAGRKAEARIDTLGKTEVQLTVIAEHRTAPPPHPITLLQAVTKGDTFEWIIEKAVELGVQRIIPLITERTIVRLEARDAAKKHEKWKRIVLEACKQCGQTWLPEMTPPVTLSAALEEVKHDTVRLVASLDPMACRLGDFWQGPQDESDVPPRRCSIAIGPEGDFSPAEHELFTCRGWHPWSLGGLVLRSETAAVCALSILSYELRP